MNGCAHKILPDMIEIGSFIGLAAITKSELRIKDVSVKKSEIKNKIENKKVKELVKDIEYTSVDQKGNSFHLLANSGRSNINNSDILDLVNVKGKITSEKRDTISVSNTHLTLPTNREV